MEAGIVLDRGHGGAIAEPEWMDGPVEKSFWVGIKTKGHSRFKVTTYRCEQCGYLESYANEHVDE